MKTIIALTLAAFAAFFTPGAIAATCDAALSWVAPTTNTDGTPLTDLAGYRLQAREMPDGVFSTVVGADSNPLLIAAGSVNYDYSVEYPDGTEYQLEFRLAAIDTAGNQSPWSNTAQKDCDNLPPAAPVLQITISGSIVIKAAQVTVTQE